MLLRPTISLVFFLAVASFPCGAEEQHCPSSIKSFHECTQYRESKLFSQFPGRFERQAGLLRINLANGEYKTYKDNPYNPRDASTGEEVVVYSVIRHFPSIGYCLIAVSYYEGGTYILLNISNGIEQEVKGDALLSSDGQRLVIWNVDIEAEYTPNLLSVYRVTPEGLALEFMEKSKDWGPEKVYWKNNRLIGFSKRFWMDNDIRTTRQTLRFSGGYSKTGEKWRIE